MSGLKRKENILHFIKHYQALPALWNVKSKEYSNKLARELAYAKLIKFCSKFDSSADKEFVVKKINNLRSAYRKELKKVQASKSDAGSNDNEVYEPKLWYFPYLLFIQDQEVPSAGMDDFDSIPLDSLLSQSSRLSGVSSSQMSPVASFSNASQTQGQFPGASHSHTQGPYPTSSYRSSPKGCFNRPPYKEPESKRSNKRKNEDEEIFHAHRARLLHPTTPPPLDENESFGQTIGLLLRNTSKEQGIYARKLMYEVMSEAELGNLSRAS
ncbi:hypothetical protein EGW08_020208, partial [Elysia chlorotica]